MKLIMFIIFSEVGSKPLLFQLEQLWKMFLQSSMQDYLSLEHLGLILRHLASTSTNTLINKENMNKFFQFQFQICLKLFIEVDVVKMVLV